MYLAAVFSNGHVATGRHHGEAFSNLCTEDKDDDVISGYVNGDGVFTTELTHTDREIIIIRHAESKWNARETEHLDSSLTMKGVSQAHATAKFVCNNIDCRGFSGFTSPFQRCLMTSLPLIKRTNVSFSICSQISEISKDFPEEGVEVNCRKKQYLNILWGDYSCTIFHKEPCKSFLARLKIFLDLLPKKSIIVTHGSVVQTLIEMALGVVVHQIPTWDNSIGNASVTYIKNGTVVWLAKETN